MIDIFGLTIFVGFFYFIIFGAIIRFIFVDSEMKQYLGIKLERYQEEYM